MLFYGFRVRSARSLMKSAVPPTAKKRVTMVYNQPLRYLIGTLQPFQRGFKSKHSRIPITGTGSGADSSINIQVRCALPSGGLTCMKENELLCRHVS